MLETVLERALVDIPTGIDHDALALHLALAEVPLVEVTVGELLPPLPIEEGGVILHLLRQTLMQERRRGLHEGERRTSLLCRGCLCLGMLRGLEVELGLWRRPEDQACQGVLRLLARRQVVCHFIVINNIPLI